MISYFCAWESMGGAVDNATSSGKKASKDNDGNDDGLNAVSGDDAIGFQPLAVLWRKEDKRNTSVSCQQQGIVDYFPTPTVSTCFPPLLLWKLPI